MPQTMKVYLSAKPFCISTAAIHPCTAAVVRFRTGRLLMLSALLLLAGASGTKAQWNPLNPVTS
jgi:hypothetical protein